MSRGQINDFDRMRMLECLLLARKGSGFVSPNPLVGAVVVKDGKVVGRGYHKRYGGPHAEVYAIRQAGKQSRGATLYVNLEPCSHTGKTPPCTELIIRSGIRRVVVGMKDPNPLVNGKGIRVLRSSGVEVDAGVLEKHCLLLNEFFVKYITRGLPFVTVKIAQTLDGKIADTAGNSRWITGEYSRRIVHTLRSRYDAVLVGAKTVVADNPRLTVRAVKGRSPYRVVLDGNLNVPLQSHILTDSFRNRTILFTSRKAAQKKRRFLSTVVHRGVHVVILDTRRRSSLALLHVLNILADMNISSLLVEGGAQIYAQFLNEGLADKCIVFISSKVFGKGLSGFEYIDERGVDASALFETVVVRSSDKDVMVEGYLQKVKK